MALNAKEAIGALNDIPPAIEPAKAPQKAGNLNDRLAEYERVIAFLLDVTEAHLLLMETETRFPISEDKYSAALGTVRENRMLTRTSKDETREELLAKRAELVGKYLEKKEAAGIRDGGISGWLRR